MLEYQMQEMTWPEIVDAMENGADTILIVATAQEQHGPHLPLATDYFWGKELAIRVAKAMDGRALIAPIIPFGPDEEMMSFPGTVTLRKESLLYILHDMCVSYERHGFRNVVLFSSHEGDFETIADAGKKFKDMDINVIAFDELGKLVKVLHEVADQFGISHDAVGAHSGEFETSIMLAAYPEKVRFDLAEEGLLIDLSKHPDFFRQDIRKVASNGVIGDPCCSTSEHGEAYWEGITSFMLNYIQSRLVS